jgi:hypothetical protein
MEESITHKSAGERTGIRSSICHRKRRVPRFSFLGIAQDAEEDPVKAERARILAQDEIMKRSGIQSNAYR